MMAFGNFLGGVGFALAKGPMMAISICAMIPFMGASVYFSLKFMRISSSDFLKAYSQSNGFAEQALGSITNHNE